MFILSDLDFDAPRGWYLYPDRRDDSEEGLHSSHRGMPARDASPHPPPLPQQARPPAHSAPCGLRVVVPDARGGGCVCGGVSRGRRCSGAAGGRRRRWLASSPGTAPAAPPPCCAAQPPPPPGTPPPPPPKTILTFSHKVLNYFWPGRIK